MLIQEASMFERLVGDLKRTPERIARRGANLRERARDGVARARSEGAERWFEIQIRAFDRAEALIEKAPDLPLVNRVTGAAERLVQRGKDAALQMPIADYDELGTKKIMKEIQALDRAALIRVRHHEASGKARKTVLDALEHELRRRQAP
jgi:hypothetical protein